MANTFVDYTVGAGQTDFAFSFPYLDDTHVVVQLDDSTGSSPGGKFYTVSTGAYTIITSPSALIRFTTAPETGARIRIKRDSASNTALVDFENGSVLTEVELDRAYLHNLYLNEEIEEGSGKNTMTKNAAGNYDGDKARIVDVADPVDPQDAVTKNYADTTFVDVAGDTMTGNLQMGANSITGVSSVQGLALTDPAGNDHAANKKYVDQQDALQVTKSGDSMSGALTLPNSDPTDGNHATRKTYVDAQIAATLATGTAGGPIDTVNIADDAITADKLADTTVTPGSYTNTNLTVDQQGRITAAASGSASPTANEILTSLKTVDGTGSGLDADLLDGQEATAFAAASHTHTASNITDFDTEVANNTAVAANTAKVTNATHTGDVTGSTALTIANGAVTSSKLDFLQQVQAYQLALYDPGAGGIEGGQLTLNLPSATAASFAETDSYLIDTFKDVSNIHNHGANQEVLRIFKGASGTTFPTSFAGNGNVSFNGSLFPNITAQDDLGTASLRWQDVYSSTGAFNGSDLNLKQDIEELNEAEKRVAVTAKGLLKKYRFKKAVTEKGSNARYHFGIIAQELKAAFQAEGLDPMQYGIIAENTWWEKTVDGRRSVSNEEQEGYSEVTEMSVRYTELLAFVIAAL